MTRLLLVLYDQLQRHRRYSILSLVLTTMVMTVLLFRIDYHEDISAFLPIDSRHWKILKDEQELSGASRIIAIFQSTDTLSAHSTEKLRLAIEDFIAQVDIADTAHVISELVTQDEFFHSQEMLDAVYRQVPYLLSETDYLRIDSLLAQPDFVARQLEADKQLLLLPTAGLVGETVRHDPLNLFSPVLARMQPSADGHRSVVFIHSPYGASETEHNARLVDLLQSVGDSVSQRHASVDIHLTGGPVIAVGNSRQIKTDSMVSVAVAITLILVLLFRTFRNVRHLLLIMVSIGWGWIFAMGCLSVVHQQVSIIVVGISSVIVGIAVNYPLHFIAHLGHAADVRATLREIAMPLVVGNITTVGAFLTLVPLQAVALRDLGLFSAFLLVGTMVFVLVWLPHLVSRRTTENPRSSIFDRLGTVRLESKRWLVTVVVVATLPLAYLSTRTTFDADLRNINYMTREQQHDLELLQIPATEAGSAASAARWNKWRSMHAASLHDRLEAASLQAGFSPNAFDGFYDLLATDVKPAEESFANQLVRTLSDEFNYIGWACGFIVFFFLWFSLGSIELALLSFLPMAVSWLWILGLMALLGIQFNIVSIILAAFIFGQGDDYTIFMTEGCQYEYAYRRRMLSSYKSSIIMSALIMFIGIGSLILARHPALQSLAKVTMVGMSCVVLMAYLFPPLIFHWLVCDSNGLRRRPLTLRNMLLGIDDNDVYRLVADRYRYRGVEISASVNRQLRRLRQHASIRYGTTPEKPLADNGWGETALLAALQQPDETIYVILRSAEHLTVARYAAEGIAENIVFIEQTHYSQL